MSTGLASETTKVQPAAALILTLGYLEIARGSYWSDPDDEADAKARRTTLKWLSWAATDAKQEERPFSKDYIFEWFRRLNAPKSYTDTLGPWLELIPDAEMNGFGEVLSVSDWVCKSVNHLTGIPADDILHVSELEAKHRHMDGFDDVLEKLERRDADGNGKRIWRYVWRECSVIRKAHSRLAISSSTLTQTESGETNRKPKRKRMTVKRVNEAAMKLAETMGKRFFEMSERNQAKTIGCSWETWTKTDFFNEAEKKRPASKPKKLSAPKAVSLTRELEAVTGEGERDEILVKLTAEQERDDRSRKVHSGQRL